MRESVGYLSFEVSTIDSVRLFVTHEGTLANPKTSVKVTADVWMVTNKDTTLSNKRKNHTIHAPNCDVDLKNRTISKSGKPLKADNLEEVVNEIEEYIGNL